jgi:hypothetical protein
MEKEESKVDGRNVIEMMRPLPLSPLSRYRRFEGKKYVAFTSPRIRERMEKDKFYAIGCYDWINGRVRECEFSGYTEGVTDMRVNTFLDKTSVDI